MKLPFQPDLLHNLLSSDLGPFCVLGLSKVSQGILHHGLCQSLSHSADLGLFDLAEPVVVELVLQWMAEVEFEIQEVINTTHS